MINRLKVLLAILALAVAFVVTQAGPADAHACPVRTDQPHLSSHVPGNVNVTGTTECFGGWVYVRTDLYRQRWYGLQFIGRSERSGTNWIQTHTAYRCAGTGLHTYVAYSYHSAGAHPGSSYQTSNTARFSC
jgi:hypothetical protein